MLKGTKSFAFWDIDFKLVIKKQDSESSFDLLVPCPRDSDRKTCFRKSSDVCLSLI